MAESRVGALHGDRIRQGLMAEISLAGTRIVT